jgi:hypothetical protein
MRADFRSDRMAAKALPTDVLQDVAYLNDADEGEEQISILSFIVRSQESGVRT